MKVQTFTYRGQTPKDRKLLGFSIFDPSVLILDSYYLLPGKKTEQLCLKVNFLCKKSQISRWAQVDDVVSVVDNYENKNNDYLSIVLELLDKMEDLHGSAHF